MANMLKVLLGNVLFEVAASLAKRGAVLRGYDVRGARVFFGLVRPSAENGETRGTSQLN